MRRVGSKLSPQGYSPRPPHSRHLYFLDDHLFGHPRFAAALFDGMRGMGRLWQAAATLESGYWRAYHDFYRWRSILRGAWTKDDWEGKLRHLAYAGGWKKFEPLWDWVIRARRVSNMLPLLESILGGFGGLPSRCEEPDTATRGRIGRREFDDVKLVDGLPQEYHTG